MVEAIDSLISEKLAEEMTEFHEDRKQLAEAKAKYAIAMRENANLLKGFVMESLKKEVSELHEDQKAMASKFAVLEDFIVEQLAKEIAEFQEDKTDLAETKVRLVREGKQHIDKVKKHLSKEVLKQYQKQLKKVYVRRLNNLKKILTQHVEMILVERYSKHLLTNIWGLT
jgi:hypothetical protein